MDGARERIFVDGGDWNARSAVKRVPNDSVAAQFEVTTKLSTTPPRVLDDVILEMGHASTS
jgi:hypothetical protein